MNEVKETKKVNQTKDENDTKEISLRIGELEQLGVGWKIWEGGLVLARWIQQNKRNFNDYRCLEVGAGLYLPHSDPVQNLNLPPLNTKF